MSASHRPTNSFLYFRSSVSFTPSTSLRFFPMDLKEYNNYWNSFHDIQQRCMYNPIRSTGSIRTTHKKTHIKINEK